MATFDLLLSPRARAFLEGLPADERIRLLRALDVIAASPFPDGVTRRYLPPPYRPGTIATVQEGFVIAYLILTGLCLFVASIDRPAQL